MRKIDKNYLIVVLISLISIFIVMPNGTMFGSMTDWLAQHISFPEYFRNLFYETHEIFPSLALNIGAGQNIYYFSYYGLLNPIILLSYLLPFVNMTVYIIISNMILYISFGIITYKWLKKHFNDNMSLVLTIISLLASPVLFHFHRHFMFVDYLPFLVLGLIGVDNYFDKNKSLMITVSIFIMIMMSYYYSITGIITIVIYYIYRYIELNKKLTPKKFIIDLLKFSIPIILGVMLSAVLIVPTFFALIMGRETGEATSVLKLIKPTLNIDAIVYSSYTIGLTAIAVLSTICMFMSEKKNNRFLSILLFVIITIPLFVYILNGTLYIRDKVLIPFIPLFILLIGNFLNELFSQKIKLKNIILICILTSILFFIFGYKKNIYYIEILLLLISIIIYYKKKCKTILIVYILLSSFVSFIITNMDDEYVKIEKYVSLYNKNKISNINSISEDNMVRYASLEDTLYSINKVYNDNYYQASVYSSTSNESYKNFYTNIFKNNLGHRNQLILSSTSNIFYQMFMGVKYNYSTSGVVGYNEIGKNIYENDDVLPIFYVSYNTISQKSFNSIEYPYNMEALLKNTVVDENTNNKFESKIKEYDLKYTVEPNDNLIVQKQDNMYYLTALTDVKFNLKLSEKLKNEILIITFRVNNQHKCSIGDSEIEINGVVNKLTCKRELYQNNNYVFHYVISSNKDIDKLKIKIKQGLYIIEDIKTYKISYDDIKNINDDVTEAKVNMQKTKGDTIEVNVENTEDGYFVTSLPYDENYKIYVDGTLTEYEKVNTSFIGFKLKKGKHVIRMEYKSKGLLIGQVISITGLVLTVVLVLINKNWRKHAKTRKNKQKL